MSRFDRSALMEQLRAMVGLFDGVLRTNLEETGMSYGLKVRRLKSIGRK